MAFTVWRSLVLARAIRSAAIPFFQTAVQESISVPAKINFVPEITVQHIEKSSIAWLEQKEIELLFLASALALQLEYQAQNEGKGIPLMVKLYDNKGNVVNLSDKGSQ